MGRVRETEQHIGKSGFVIFAQIDHATIAITLDTYSRLVPGMGDQAANAMESVLE